MLSPNQCMLAVAAAAMIPGLGMAQVAVSPPAPAVLDTVRLQVPSSGPGVWDLDRTRITMSGNVIEVTLRSGPFFDPAPPPRIDEFLLGQFPAGAYTVNVHRDNGAGTVDSLGTVAFNVSSNAASRQSPPFANFSDLWWNPQQSGWGLNVIQHASGNLFVTWFAYRGDGQPGWYVVPGGSWTQGSVFQGGLYWATGPVVGNAFDAAKVKLVYAGTAKIAFDAMTGNTGSFAVQFDTGHGWSSPIARQPF